MKQYDHIRVTDEDVNEAVGNALGILNNKRRKNNTVTFEDIQIAFIGTVFVIVVYSYEDATQETAPEPRPRWIGVQPESGTLQEIQKSPYLVPARQKFISTDVDDG